MVHEKDERKIRGGEFRRGTETGKPGEGKGTDAPSKNHFRRKGMWGWGRDNYVKGKGGFGSEGTPLKGNSNYLGGHAVRRGTK